MAGMPVESENRTVTGIAGPANKAALLSAEASLVGVKLPSTTTPFAWLARIPGCWPHILFITSTVCSATDASCAEALIAAALEKAMVAMAQQSLIERMGILSSGNAESNSAARDYL